MNTGDFGAVQQGADPGAGTSSVEQQLNQPQEIINENDPRLTSEVLDMNVTGDAYAMPAPPPDGLYRAKLKLSQVTDATGAKKDYEVKVTKGKGGSAKVPYLSTGLEATITTPGPFENLKVFDSWVATFQGRDGSSKISTIIAKLRKTDGTPYLPPGPAPHWSAKEWMDLFVKIMSTEPEVGIETQWEWSCEACGKLARDQGKDYPKSVTGMNNFSVDEEKSKVSKTGKVYKPEMRCQIDPAHMFSKARPRIARVLSLDELNASLKKA